MKGWVVVCKGGDEDFWHVFLHIQCDQTRK